MDSGTKSVQTTPSAAAPSAAVPSAPPAPPEPPKKKEEETPKKDEELKVKDPKEDNSLKNGKIPQDVSLLFFLHSHSMNSKRFGPFRSPTTETTRSARISHPIS